MKQYYGAEITKNPIWLLRRKKGLVWETIGVFHSRERAMEYGNYKRHELGDYRHDTGNGGDWDVYSIPLQDEELAIAVGKIREAKGLPT
jgi:hypothetical protein